MTDAANATSATSATSMVLKPEGLDRETIGRLFGDARSYNGWQKGDVSDETLRRLYDIMKWGPTSMNTQPARILFLKSSSQKERLKPFLSPGNVEKTLMAPVVAIIGYDLEFYQLLPRTFPHLPTAKSYFEGKPDHIQATAFRNGSLQGAYLILAARAVGLDCGPMSGFNNQGVDQEFFAGTSIKSNFLCGLGRGDPAKVFGRSPRLDFDDTCKIL